MAAGAHLPRSFELISNSTSFRQGFDGDAGTRATPEIVVSNHYPANNSLQEPEADGNINIIGQWELTRMAVDPSPKKGKECQDLVKGYQAPAEERVVVECQHHSTLLIDVPVSNVLACHPCNGVCDGFNRNEPADPSMEYIERVKADSQ
ncbi:MAG: hypothetical protein Q9171_002339 [Xanthocarpia ochracea]